MGILMLVAGLAVPLMSISVLFLLPPRYASTSRIDVGVADPAARGTEMAKLQSSAVLSQVISNLDLSAKWGEKYKEGPLPGAVAEALLRRDLRVQPQRSTTLIEVRVESNTPEEAATIANQITEVYRASALSPRSPDGKPTVQIIDKAQPDFRPARPDKTKAILIAGGLGIVLCAAGVLLLVASGRPRKPADQR